MTNLALVVIARNEARCITRCLESAKPFVDKMVVLDTGSSDDTVALATAAGAVVHHYSWTNDFAAARNAALGYADSEWNLMLDADEWIETGGKALREAIAGSTPFLGRIPVENQFDLNGKVETSILWIPRLLPRGVRYQGIIHEQPISDLPKKNITVRIGHDGYRKTSLDQKRGRNEALLLAALEKAPNDPYLLFELGRTNEVYEDYKKAAQYFQKALAASKPDDFFHHELVVRSIVTFKNAGLYQQAIALSEEQYDAWQDSPDYFFALGDLYLACASKEPARANEILPLVEFSWKKALAVGEKPALFGAVEGRGSYLAAENLSVLYQELKLTDLAAEYRTKAQKMRAAKGA